MPTKDRTDVMNNAILMAGELGFRAVQQFLAQNPNPPGQIPDKDAQPRMTRDDIRRLLRGG